MSDWATVTAAMVTDPDGGVVARLVNDACVAVLGASETGVMVVDPRGGVDLVAASDERASGSARCTRGPGGSTRGPWAG